MIARGPTGVQVRHALETHRELAWAELARTYGPNYWYEGA